MATKAKENKAAKSSENKTEDETKTVETADFLAQFEGKALNVQTFEEAYPGRGEEIFRNIARPVHGEFPITSGVQLGFPKTEANRRKMNEAVARLNLEAK